MTVQHQLVLLVGLLHWFQYELRQDTSMLHSIMCVVYVLRSQQTLNSPLQLQSCSKFRFAMALHRLMASKSLYSQSYKILKLR
jgi:hypothetical protein